MREVIDVGENAQKIGKKLEQLGVDLLGMFKWNKKMSDKEIKCTRSTHKNAEGKPKQTHGIDLYMEYKDPYIGSVQGVFIECKNRVWSKINQKEIERWVNEELNLIVLEIIANYKNFMRKEPIKIVHYFWLIVMMGNLIKPNLMSIYQVFKFLIKEIHIRFLLLGII